MTSARNMPKDAQAGVRLFLYARTQIDEGCAGIAAGSGGNLAELFYVIASYKH